jgi:hypothetical protein
MRRLRSLTLTLLFLLTLAAGAAAKTVTVGATTTPWRWGTASTAYLLVYANAGFTPSTPRSVDYVRAGARGSGNYYLAVACTVTGGTLTIPAFQIESTDDSPDNPKATYTFVLADDRKQEKEVYAANMILTLTYGTSVTWDQLRIFQAQSPGPPPAGVYNTRQVDNLIQSGQFSNPATPFTRGVMKSSANVADPTAYVVGDTSLVLTGDPRLSDQRTPTDGSVTTAKLADANVTTAKLASSSVTYPKLAPDALGTAESPAGWSLVGATLNPVFDATPGAGKCTPSDAATNHRAAEPRWLMVGGRLLTLIRGLQVFTWAESTDGGQTWGCVGTALSIGSAGSWDDNALGQAVVTYHTGDASILGYYSGSKSGVAGNNGVGWFTCSPTTLVCTKQGQILTKAQMATSVGASAPDVPYVVGFNERWRAADGTMMISGFVWTTTDLNNPYPTSKVFECEYTESAPGSVAYYQPTFDVGTQRFVNILSVYQFNAGGPFYAFASYGSTATQTLSDSRAVVLLTSQDGKSWPLPKTLSYVMVPTGVGTGFLGNEVTGLWILKDPADANNLLPLAINNKYLFSATGFDNATVPIDGGVFFGTPASVRQSKYLLSAYEADNVIAPVEFGGQGVARGTISARSDPFGTDIAVCANGKLFNDTIQGSRVPRLDSYQPSLCGIFGSSHIGGKSEPRFDVLGLNAGAGLYPFSVTLSSGAHLGIQQPAETWDTNQAHFYFGRDQNISGGIGSSNANALNLTQNAYFDSGCSCWKYISSFASAPASGVTYTSGGFQFRTAPSGAAGANVPWTTILQNGKRGIITPALETGTTSNTDLAGQLTVGGGGTVTYSFAGTYTNAPICTASDTNATPATTGASATTTTLTVAGTAGHVVNYVCVVRN